MGVLEALDLCDAPFCDCRCGHVRGDALFTGGPDHFDRRLVDASRHLNRAVLAVCPADLCCDVYYPAGVDDEVRGIGDGAFFEEFAVCVGSELVVCAACDDPTP